MIKRKYNRQIEGILCNGWRDVFNNASIQNIVYVQ